MNAARILGITIFVIGIGLLVTGYNATEAPLEQLSETFTGKYSDSTMWYLISGGAALVCGVLIAAFGGGRARA